MKHFLSLLGLDVNKTLCLTVGSPSAHRRNSRLKHLAFMLLFLLGSLNVWGDEVTLTLSDATTDTWTNQGASGSGTAIAMNDNTVTGITLSGTSGYCNTSSGYTQVYASSTFTISSTVGDITKIVINAKYKKTEGSIADENSNSKSLTGSFADYTFNYTGVSSMTFTSTKQNYVAYITVTYTPSGGGSTPTCATPTFSPAAGTFYGSQEITLATSTAGAAIYYTTDNSTPSSTNGTLYSAPFSITETTTVKAIAIKAGADDSEVASTTYTKGESVTTYDIDFETNVKAAYINWIFTNAEIAKNGDNTNISAHAGTHYGTTGGKATASIQTAAKIANPGSFSCYVSKQSNNTTSSTWYIQVSENGEDWTDAASQSATSMDAGDWVEFSADLSEYSNVYVRLYYSGSTAVRNVDDISLEMASAVVKPTISGETPFLTSTTVTISHADADHIYYTTNGDVPTTSSTEYTEPFVQNASATVKAIAVKGSDVSAVAEATFTKATVMTVAQAQDAISALADNGTIPDQYVSGVISQVGSFNSTHKSITYYVSDDGTTTGQLEVYSGKGLNGADFSAATDLSIGADVLIFGELKKYKSGSNPAKNEINQNSRLITYKPKAILAWSEASYEAELEGENTFPTLTNTNSVTVTYSSSNTSVAEFTDASDYTTLKLNAAGTITITAAFAGNGTYKANSVSYTLQVKNSVIRADISFEENGGTAVTDLTQQSNLPNPLPVITKAGKNFGGWFIDSELETPAVAGAAVTSTAAITLYAKWLEPYSVAEALGIIEAMETNGETETAVYVAGIITPTTRSFYNNYNSITYMISDDGTATGELKVYSGKGVNNANFTAVTDLEDEDQVVVYGKLKKYQKNNTSAIEPEVNQPNYIYSLSRKEDANLSWSETSFDAFIGQSNTFPTLTKPDGVTIVYSSSNTTAATIDANTGEITLGTTSNVSTTITATLSGDATYKDDAVSYTLNVYTPANPGTITYEENGGSEVADVETPVENYPDPLPAPEKLHSSFLGWFTTSDFQVGTQVVAGAPMDGNVVLYAKWEDWSVWSYTYSSNVAIGNEDYKVKILKDNSTTEYDEFEAKRYGTGSAAGIATINVPQGTQKLHFHAAGWNNESVTLTVKVGEETYPTTFGTLVAEPNVQGNGKEYIINTPLDEYYVIDLSGYSISENEVITFTATSGNRFVLFGVNQEGGIVPVLDHIVVTGTATALEYEVGDVFNPAGLGANAIYTLGGVEQDPVAIDAEDIEWSFEPATIAANTTAVTVTAKYEDKSATKEVSGLSVTVPEPEIIVSAASLAFGNKAKGVAVDDKELTVTLKSVENATLTITGDGASAFSVTPALTASGTVTVSASAANVGTFNATLTISDDAGAAEAKTVALSITVEASDDLSGTWNLVTDAADLMAGMQVIIANVADENAVKTMGQQNSNNRAAVASTVAGTVLTPAAGTKVFTLVDAGNGKFAFQAVNGSYLYASSSTKNYLVEKATNDANGQWTISIADDGVATITAQGTNTHKLMRYNPNNNSPLFACYEISSTTGTLVTLYAKAFNYTREIAQGVLSTTCLPNGGKICGASIFEIAYMDYEADGTTPHKIYFDEVEGGIMEAGMPYVVLANEGAAKFGVYYTDSENKEAQSKKGLVGYMGEGEWLNENDYFIYDNKFFFVSATDATNKRIHISNNRAYIKLSQVPGYDNVPVVVPAPRRRVSLGNGNNAPQVATDVENAEANEAPRKVLINGELFILRGEKMYDAKGQLVK